MKKSASATPAKTAEFVYRCFKCGEEDNPKSYTRARDLMIHCVNRHQVYPQGAKHNQEYAADGTDLRPARLDKIERYASLASHKAQLKTVVPPGPKKAGKKGSTARTVKSVIVKAPEASVTEASTQEEAVGSEEDLKACRTKKTVLQGYKIPKKPFRKDKEVDAEPSVDQELIEMNRIATARAARDSAVKDAHITKQMLVEKVKKKITTHRASKTSTGGSVSDTKASVSADKDKLYARDPRSGASKVRAADILKKGESTVVLRRMSLEEAGEGYIRSTPVVIPFPLEKDLDVKSDEPEGDEHELTEDENDVQVVLPRMPPPA